MSKLQTIKFPGQNRSHLLTSKFCRRKISTSNCTHHSSTRSFFSQEVIGNGPGKLENKFRGVARNTRWRFPVWVTNSTVCSIREYGFLFEYVRRCGKRTGDKLLVEEVTGRGRGGGNDNCHRKITRN